MNNYVKYDTKRKVYICKVCQKAKKEVEIINLVHMLEHMRMAHGLVSKVKIEPKGKKGYKTTIKTK